MEYKINVIKMPNILKEGIKLNKYYKIWPDRIEGKPNYKYINLVKIYKPDLKIYKLAIEN